MKKLISFFISVIILTGAFSVGTLAVNDSEIKVNAKAAVLMDASTGEVLFSFNENEKLYPASVTKIMPLLLFMEALDSGKIALTDVVTASPTAASKGGSQIWLKEGEQMTEAEMSAYIASHMARHKVPRYIRFVDKFPMNAAGKILKYKMREEAEEWIKAGEPQ